MADSLTGNFSGVNPTQTLRAKNLAAKATASAPVVPTTPPIVPVAAQPVAPVVNTPAAPAVKTVSQDPTSIFYATPSGVPAAPVAQTPVNTSSDVNRLMSTLP